jgi:predicted Ser/Thr protein kinase
MTPSVSSCAACGTANEPGARFCKGCGATLAAAEGDPLLGQLVAARYRLVRMIGEGGMGAVYLAEQAMGTARRKVAVKVLKGPPSELARARFLRECETVVQLSHPNTIQFFDAGALADGRLFIAMEYVEGRPLTAAIAEGPMPWPKVERLVEEIGGSLAEAHRHGIVHRDLKPDNVLLARHGDDEHARVLDFGIAKQRERGEGPELTVAGTIVGTPAYMSPEQLAGAEVDARSDIYALGLMTFEMLTGRRPFQGSTPFDWATLHTTHPPPSFDDFPATRSLPQRARDAVYRALAKEPQERQASVKQFVDEFRSSAPSTGSGVAVPLGPPAPPAPMPSRPPWLLAAGAAMGAVAVVGLWLILRPDAPAVPDAPDAGAAANAPRSEPDAGPPPLRRAWLQIVAATDDTDDPALALGPPDGRCAVIRPNGKVLLEVGAELLVRGDGSPAPELEVIVDAARSGPYRVDLLVTRRRDEALNVASDLVGSTPLDIDEVAAGLGYRYVRIKNRSARGNVCLDAVGVYLR